MNRSGHSLLKNSITIRLFHHQADKPPLFRSCEQLEAKGWIEEFEWIPKVVYFDSSLLKLHCKNQLNIDMLRRGVAAPIVVTRRALLPKYKSVYGVAEGTIHKR